MVADDLRQSDEYKELQRIKETPAPETHHVEDRAATPEPEIKPKTVTEAPQASQEQLKDEDSTTILKDIRNLLQSLLEAFKSIFKKD